MILNLGISLGGYSADYKKRELDFCNLERENKGWVCVRGRREWDGGWSFVKGWRHTQRTMASIPSFVFKFWVMNCQEMDSSHNLKGLEFLSNESN